MSYFIGIDLGTTNSTLASASLTDESPQIKQLLIPQRLTRDLEGEKPFLPSFYFFPLSEEEAPPCVGFYAKERGVELPDRVIASAKSWLSYDAIDRRMPFLPLGDFEEKKSPIDICIAFLEHLRSAWEKANAPHRFSDQHVLVTVPASFDPSSRELVQEAAKLAGFPEILLIEEPLAAFYAWLHRHEGTWRDQLKVGETVLIVDIGGGTTDFSLIRVGESDSKLVLERQAVGNHLLLGGDNFDLSLAYKVKGDVDLSDWQMQSLRASCRNAKEHFLGDEPPETISITIPGRGSSLIGGALRFDLKREEVLSILLEGFFPIVGSQECAVIEKRTALSRLGLPYVRDPRITAQLATFLAQAGGSLPSAVLFNGGTMKANAFQERILDQLSQWKGMPVLNLQGADLDFGVSQGAVYYGWARQGKGIRVRAGTSRSYFIGIESAELAVPGVEPSLKAVCLAPLGMDEGTEVTLEKEIFTLLLNEPAVFRFFYQNATKEIPQVGMTLSNWKSELTELHPIETILHSQGEEGKQVLVKLKAKVTELGVLELSCVADDERKWKLEFDIRPCSKIS